MSSIIPEDKRQLRACILCSLIKNITQFRKQGCENCEELLYMRGNPDRVLECTTANFDGTLALLDPPESWVAKWQNIANFQPGLYAIRVAGYPPDEVMQELQDRGYPFVPRDGSATTT